MIAYDFPLLAMFWVLMWWFLWIAWIVLLIRVIADIFRSDDMGGVGKAIWVLFVIAVPLLGTLVYLLMHGDSMGERDRRQARAQEEQFRAYIKQAVPTVSPADELVKLDALRSEGVITEAEFAQQKAKLFA